MDIDQEFSRFYAYLVLSNTHSLVEDTEKSFGKYKQQNKDIFKLELFCLTFFAFDFLIFSLMERTNRNTEQRRYAILEKIRASMNDQLLRIPETTDEIIQALVAGIEAYSDCLKRNHYKKNDSENWVQSLAMEFCKRTRNDNVQFMLDIAPHFGIIYKSYAPVIASAVQKHIDDPASHYPLPPNAAALFS